MNAAEILGRVGESLNVRRSFGEAYEREGTLVIPVAVVAGGGGGGEGTSGDSSDEGGAPSGSGGGVGGVVVPIGVYVVGEDSVRWVPAVNVTWIALAGLATLRVLLRVVGRARRH